MEYQINQEFTLREYFLTDDGSFPNSRFPLLQYMKLIAPEGAYSAGKTIELLEQNHCGKAWKNGIFDYHHYHSNAHEVLVCYMGKAEVQFGGPEGIELEFSTGDAVIIPAGVAHKCIHSENGFRCLGAYAGNRDYDMNYGNPTERPHSDHQIALVPHPQSDPFFGKHGPLLKHWLNQSEHA